MTNETQVALQNHISVNPAMGAVMYVLSQRERDRKSLTIRGLLTKLKDLGFEYEKHEYQAVFKTLADLGIGKLVYTKRGRIFGLNEIAVPLKTLGQMVKNFPDFTNKINQLRKPKLPVDQPSKISLKLVVEIGKGNLTIPIDKSMNANDIAQIVAKMQKL